MSRVQQAETATNAATRTARNAATGTYFQISGEDQIYWAEDSLRLEDYVSFETADEYFAHRKAHGMPQVTTTPDVYANTV